MLILGWNAILLQVCTLFYQLSEGKIDMEHIFFLVGILDPRGGGTRDFK